MYNEVLQNALKKFASESFKNSHEIKLLCTNSKNKPFDQNYNSAIHALKKEKQIFLQYIKILKSSVLARS